MAVGEVVRCTECPGWVDTGRSETIMLPKLDEVGARVLNRAGEPTFVYMKRPYHVFPPSILLALPLVPAACSHGLPEHPDPEHNALFKGRGRSWIKSRYVQFDGRCVIDMGQERPDDLTCGIPIPIVA